MVGLVWLPNSVGLLCKTSLFSYLNGFAVILSTTISCFFFNESLFLLFQRLKGIYFICFDW